MTVDEIKGWQKRLWWSFICAIIAVIASTIIVGTLSSMVKPGAERNGLSGADIAAYILGFPLAPGWLIVKGIFGEWGMVHGGQIVLIWPLSLAIDSILIFLVWEFLHRKASSELTSKGTLGLGG
jgi:uncharacterized SAM-binding protein YcdF (DUF218 family)